MAGMVGVISPDTSRYVMFWICLSSLEKPVNTMPAWAVTSDRILGRNNCVEQALDKGAEWLLFLDDDHTFSSNILTRLLAHNAPIVGALYFQRMVPFAPVAYEHKTEDEIYIPLNLHNHGENDLVEVVAIGTGGMLIRSEVFHAMKKPYFEHGRASEDLIFCDKARELGFPIYCDLGTRMGHISPAALWPAHDGTDWQVGFSFTDGFSVTLPIEREEATVNESA